MKSTIKERTFLIKMFRNSWMETMNFQQRTIFRRLICRQHKTNDFTVTGRVKREVLKDLRGNEMTKSIGLFNGFPTIEYFYFTVPIEQIYTPFEKMLDQMENIRELIHTKPSLDFGDFAHVRVWPTDKLKIVLMGMESQIGDFLEVWSESNNKILGQLLKGFISEL